MIIKDLFIGNFRISQLFGKNPQMYAKFGLKGHNGIDFACPTGTQLVCCFDEAEVITAEDDKTGYGKHIKLWDKKQQLVAIYGHCKELLVKVGDRVKFGNLIAISNNTGFSTGPHLHFGVCKVDKNCKRLNTNNGYSGWINPLEDFVWETENLKKPIEESGIIDDMTTEEKNILNFLKEQKADEGKVREAFGCLNDMPQKNKQIQTLSTKVIDLDLFTKDLLSRIEVLEGEIKANNDLVISWQQEVTTATKQIRKISEDLEAMTQQKNKYKNYYEKALDKSADKLTIKELFTLLVNKIFKK